MISNCSVHHDKTDSFKSTDHFNPIIHQQKRSSVTNESTNLYSIKQGSFMPKRNSIFLISSQFKEIKSDIRHDVYGNAILKGSKAHKVSFIDYISNNKFTETIVINSKHTKDNKDGVECTCSGTFSSLSCDIY